MSRDLYEFTRMKKNRLFLIISLLGKNYNKSAFRKNEEASSFIGI